MGIKRKLDSAFGIENGTIELEIEEAFIFPGAKEAPEERFEVETVSEAIEIKETKNEALPVAEKQIPDMPQPKALRGINIQKCPLKELQSLIRESGYRQVITGLTLIGNWGRKYDVATGPNSRMYQTETVENLTKGLKRDLKKWRNSLDKDEQKKLIVKK